MDTQQFEVIRPKCAGLDVHKKSVVAAVCMESTGKYWIPIFNILEPHMQVILTHPITCFLMNPLTKKNVVL